MNQTVQIREGQAEDTVPHGPADSPDRRAQAAIPVSLLTGGRDRPYVFGLATELMAKGLNIDLIGSDHVDAPEFHNSPNVAFLNLRGDQSSGVGLLGKLSRTSRYYLKLIAYAAKAKPKIFHILWNNKFEPFDRTLLMLYYKALGKKIVLTVHNVNAGVRDSTDSTLNRLTLRIQYHLADHIFVHTEKMKLDLLNQFAVPEKHVSVIPFGINNSAPSTALTPAMARKRLGIEGGEKAILFFGNIAPYKGLDYLVAAFRQLLPMDDSYRLIIAGWPKNCESYWTALKRVIETQIPKGRVLLRAEFIPDDETELYFKAADVLVLPYKHIYQSGVLFLGHSFGLPVLAADVGSLKDEIVEGETGFVFAPEDPVAIVKSIERYFASDLFANLNSRRPQVRAHALESHSWDVVGNATVAKYTALLRS